MVDGPVCDILQTSSYRAQSMPNGRPFMCSGQAPIVKLEALVAAVAAVGVVADTLPPPTAEVVGDVVRELVVTCKMLPLMLLLFGERCGVSGDFNC